MYDHDKEGDTNEKIIVGKSVSSPDLLGTIFFISLLSLLFSWFLALYAGRNWFWVLWIGLSVVNLCLWLPVVAVSHKYWLVDQDHIGYVQIDRWLDQLLYGLCIRKGSQGRFLHTIKLSKIDTIGISWTRQLSIWSTTSYTLILKIRKKDGSRIIIPALNKDAHDFLTAMDELKAAGAKINDPHKLIEAIRNGKNIWTYVNHEKKMSA